MKFLFFITAEFAMTAQRNAKSKNPYFAAHFGKLTVTLCEHFAPFAVKIQETKVSAINCRVLTIS